MSAVLAPAAPPVAVTPLLSGDFLGALFALLGQGAAVPAAPITAPGAQHADDGGEDPARADEPRSDSRDLDAAPIIVAAMPGGAWMVAPASLDARLAGAEAPGIRIAETPTAETRTAAAVRVVPEIVRLPRPPAAETSGDAPGIAVDQEYAVSAPPGVRLTGMQAPDIRTAATPTVETRTAAAVRVVPEIVRLPRPPAAETDGDATGVTEDQGHAAAPAARADFPRAAALPVSVAPSPRAASSFAPAAAEPGALALPSPDAMSTVFAAPAPSSPVPVAQEPAAAAAADPSPARGAPAPTPFEPTVTTEDARRTLTPRAAASADARLTSVSTRDQHDVGHDATDDEPVPHAGGHARPAAGAVALAPLAPRGPEYQSLEEKEDGARGDGRERGDAPRVGERDGHAAAPAAPPLSHPELPSHVGGPDGRPEGIHAPRAGEPSVVDQIVTGVRLIHRDGRHEMSLRLDPPELGTVRIAATLEGRHLTLDIKADQEAAQVILERSLPQLRELLARQGFDTDQVTVRLGLSFSGRGSANGGADAWRMPGPPEPVARAASAVPVLPSRHDTDHEGIDLWV